MDYHLFNVDFLKFRRFIVHRLEKKTCSLFCLIEGPLVKGAMFDVSNESMLGLTQTLCSSRTVQLKHIVDVAGTELNNVDAVANLMGQRSTHHTAKIIELWKSKLTEEELSLLKGFKDGFITLDWTDPFPKLGFTPYLKDISGSILDLEEFKNLDLTMLGGKCCINVL